MSMDAGGSSPSVDIADGDAAAARSQHGIAIDHYTRAIASGHLGASEMLEAYAKRADAYVMQSDASGGIDANLVAALEDYSRVRTAVPNFMPAAMGEAHAYQGLGAYNEALRSYKDAYELDQDRNHYWTFLGIGSTYRMAGDNETAMRYYNRVLEAVGPSGGMAVFYHRGRALFAAGKYREAIDSLSTGIPQQRGYSWAYTYRACAYARVGEYDKSLADYDAALVFMRRSEAEYGSSAFWQKSLDRLAAERASVLGLSRGSSPTIATSALCEAFEPKKERSTLLPPSNGPLPDLGILSGGEMGTPGI